MPTEIAQDQKRRSEYVGNSTIGRGYLMKGKWRCECDSSAAFLTTRKTGVNNNRKFWRCPNSKSRCGFFIWEDDEPAAREWVERSRPQPVPQTPMMSAIPSDGPLKSVSLSRGRRNAESSLLETPFTKEKRKRVVISVPEHIDEDIYSRDANLSSTATTKVETPPQKMLKRTPNSTSGLVFTDKLRSNTVSLPTPNSVHTTTTSTPSVQPQPLQLDATLTPSRVGDMANQFNNSELDLASTILKLIHSDTPKPKVSTEIQLRHEIELHLDLDAAKEQRHKDTISRLSKRVEELETLVRQIIA